MKKILLIVFLSFAVSTFTAGYADAKLTREERQAARVQKRINKQVEKANKARYEWQRLNNETSEHVRKRTELEDQLNENK